MADDVLELLENFVLNNPDLERLEAVLDDFNPFVAMGWTRQEVRHSLFIRWLLDPRETHGLGPYFLRQFLKMAVAQSHQRTDEMPTVVDLDSWPYAATTVVSEWNNIDLFIRDDAQKFICVIENKMDSTEHSNQLQKYRSQVEHQFRGYRKLFIYLTISGEAPSDEVYISLSHAQVATLVEETLSRRHDQLNEGVIAFASAYVEMVRRNIVEDSEIQRICEKIYQTHRKALDVLFEYRPDRQSEVRDFLAGLVQGSNALELDRCSKTFTRFSPKAWDLLPRAGTNWTPSGRLILCELDQTLPSMRIKIILGPGEEKVRNQVAAWIREHGAAFNKSGTKLYPQWWTFHAEEWATKKQCEEGDIEKLKEHIRDGFDAFLNKLEHAEDLFAGFRAES